MTIDNLDGRGAVDYSGALWAGAPLRVERVLNAPSRCLGTVALSGTTLAVPVRRGRVVVSDVNGNALFTGYLAKEPEAVYAGVGTAGAVYRYALDAVSDEWLLDRLAVPSGGAGLGVGGGQVLRTLTTRVGSGLVSAAGVAAGRTIGVFQPVPTDAWSVNAGALAGAAYGAYRVVNGALTFASAGSVTHTLADGDGVFVPGALAAGSVKELANDVTVSGETEPAAYVTEMFAGDGTTAVFVLGEMPYKTSAARAKLVADEFDEGTINPAVWSVTDPGSHLALGTNGLVMSGGNGFDGQTTLTAIDAVEMGGSLVVEAGSVALGAASDGVLCGLYGGAALRSNCFAGYALSVLHRGDCRRSNGVQGVPTGFADGAEFAETNH